MDILKNTEKQKSRKKYANIFVLVYPLVAVQGYNSLTVRKQAELASRGQAQNTPLHISFVKKTYYTKIGNISVSNRQKYGLKCLNLEPILHC